MILRSLNIILVALAVIVSVHGQNASDMLSRAQKLRMTNLDSSNRYATQAYRLALDQGLDTTARKSQFLLGMNLQMQGDLDQAVSVYKQMLNSVEDNTYPEEYIQAYGRLGDSYTDMGEYDSAAVYLLTFDALVDEHWSPNKIDAKLLLGELYRAMGRMDRSDEYKIEAIKRSKRGDNTMEQTIALYYYLDDHKGELESEKFQQYLSDYLDLMNGKSTSHIEMSHIGMFVQGQDQNDRVEVLLDGIAGSDRLGYHSTTLIYRTLLAEEYLKTENYSAACEQAARALELTNEVDDKRYESDVNYLLFRCHEGLKKYDDAIEYLLAHHRVKDQLQDIEVTRNIDALEIQYETAQKEAQIIEQELTLRKSKYQRNLLLAGLGAVVWFGTFLVIYFWNRNRITKRLALQESQINEQKIIQLEQERSMLAMTSMIKGQEAERKRIAQDLHDGLGGLLSSVKAQLHDIERRVDALAGVDLYAQASHMIDEASSEVRRIAYDMMPTALSKLGLKAAIEDLASRLESHHNLKVDLQLFDIDKRLEETTEVMLYRIIQEACNNIVKHAKATEVLIQTSKIQDDLMVVVEDNGHGFKENSDKVNSGIGLKSIESRMKFLEGQVDIASTEKGTCITLQIPVE